MASRIACGSWRLHATSSQPSTTVNALDTSCNAPAKSDSRTGPLGGGRLTGAPERITRKPYYVPALIASSFPCAPESSTDYSASAPLRVNAPKALSLRRYVVVQFCWNEDVESAIFSNPRFPNLHQRIGVQMSVGRVLAVFLVDVGANEGAGDNAAVS